MDDAIEAIHLATGIFTREPSVQRLLDAVDWPRCGGRLADYGAGHGDFIVPATSWARPCKRAAAARWA